MQRTIPTSPEVGAGTAFTEFFNYVFWLINFLRAIWKYSLWIVWPSAFVLLNKQLQQESSCCMDWLRPLQTQSWHVDLSLSLYKSKSGRHDQVVKGIWWMSWRWEAMKDVAGCDKPRGGANTLWSVDFRMGQPTSFEVFCTEYIGVKSKPGELKHLSNQRKGYQQILC